MRPSAPRPPAPFSFHRFFQLRYLGASGLLFLLALPALLPLFSRQLSDGYDNVFHLWRAVQIEALLREGILYSRWAPHMAQGYGYPLFQFQAPLSAYAAAALRLLGLDWPLALNATFALTLLFSAGSMALLGRALWGEMGGWLTAVAYLYAPYHAYVVFYRGSLSESAAWVFAPLVLWGLWAWVRQGRRAGLATAVFAQVALMLSHEPTAYAFYPLFLLWPLAAAPTAAWRQRALHYLPLLLGLSGSAFFWLPALLERPFVQFQRIASDWPFRYFDNFLPLGELLALPRRADPFWFNDWPPRALGGLLLALALVGLLLAWQRQRPFRPMLLLLALALGGYSFMTLTVSEPIWQVLPPLHAFTPWRFVTQASLCAALLAGGLIFMPHGSQKPAASFAILALLLLAHLGWFAPRHVPAPADTSLTGMIAWEAASGTLGTTAKNELLPIWAESVSAPTTAVAPWQARLDPATLPDGAVLHRATYAPLRATIELETAVPFTATYQALYFPGWQATLNGTAVSIAPEPRSGLITIPIPTGRHTLGVRFGETPLRQMANGLSALAWLALAGVWWWGKRPFVTSYIGYTQKSKTVSLCPLLLLATLLLLARLLLELPALPLRQSRLTADGQLKGLPETQRHTFGGQVALLGWDPIAAQLRADEPLRLKLYWRALQLLTADYRVGVVLVDAQGRRWSEAGLRDERWHRNPPPTPSWPTEKYVTTAYLVDLLPGTPPGTYQIQLSLFARESLQPLTATTAADQPIGPHLILGSVQVLPPRRPPTDLRPQFPLAFTANGLRLWGAQVDRAQAAPGDPALVTLFWSAAPQQETAVALRLLDERETVAHEWALKLPALPDGVWRDQVLLKLPLTLANGRYAWQFGASDGLAVTWGSLEINAPVRQMSAPPVAQRLGQTLGQNGAALVTLVGYTAMPDAPQPGETLTLTLVWRGEQEMEESYHVFVHLLNADGALMAQADGQPVGWSRPTTGWLPGEYVSDVHTLRLPAGLPPGEYGLLVGLYVPGNGRLRTPDGRDSLTLRPLEIGKQ